MQREVCDTIIYFDNVFELFTKGCRYTFLIKSYTFCQIIKYSQSCDHKIVRNNVND